MVVGPHQKTEMKATLNFDCFCYLWCLKKGFTMGNALIFTSTPSSEKNMIIQNKLFVK